MGRLTPASLKELALEAEPCEVPMKSGVTKVLILKERLPGWLLGEQLLSGDSHVPRHDHEISRGGRFDFQIC